MVTKDKPQKGDIISIIMKPAILKEWQIVGETRNSYIIDKRRGSKQERYQYSGKVYVPKKNILMITQHQRNPPC